MRGEELHSFAQNHIVKSVDFSPDSNHLLTGSNEKLLRIYDLNKPEVGKKIHSLSVTPSKWIKYVTSCDDFFFV